MEVVASLSQGRTAAAQCGLFTYKSVPVIFEPPCISNRILSVLCRSHDLCIPNTLSEIALLLYIRTYTLTQTWLGGEKND